MSKFSLAKAWESVDLLSAEGFSQTFLSELAVLAGATVSDVG